MTDPTRGPRQRNESLAWRAVEEAKLAETPNCEECGAPAVDAHNTAGECRVSGPHDVETVESLCRTCHDATGCTAYRETATDRKLDRLL